MADFVGMLGGFIVGVGYLDIAWNAFLSKMVDSLVAWDLISGLIKSIAFAFGIGLIGLFLGFEFTEEPAKSVAQQPQPSSPRFFISLSPTVFLASFSRGVLSDGLCSDRTGSAAGYGERLILDGVDLERSTR